MSLSSRTTTVVALSLALSPLAAVPAVAATHHGPQAAPHGTVTLTAATTATTSTHAAHGVLPASMSRPCSSEGDNDCFWDASRFGNGEGKSYVVRTIPGPRPLVCVMYVKAADAHLDYCTRA